MYCEKCGAPVKPEYDFCRECGYSLKKQDETQLKETDGTEKVSPDVSEIESQNKKAKVPFFISWPFIAALLLFSVYIIFAVPVPCILAVLRILHNKKHPEYKLSRIKKIILICLGILLGLTYTGSIVMYVDSKKSDKVYAAIDSEDFVLAAELMSEYYGENPDVASECSIYYEYYLAQGDYEKAADAYLSYFEENPGEASDFYFGRIDDISDNLSDNALSRLSAVRKLVADLHTTTTTEKATKEEKTTASEKITKEAKTEKAEKTTKEETTTKAKAEKTTKAKVEKTTKAKVEKTTKAKVEKTTKAKVEKTTKAKVEKTTKAKVEKTTKAKVEKTTKAKVEKTTKAEKKKLSFFEKRKIDKEFNKVYFEDIGELYPELSVEGKEYAVSKAEEYLHNRFRGNYSYLDDIESIKSTLNTFTSAGMSSELLTSAKNAVTVLYNYRKMHSELPLAYKGPIPSNAQEELLNVYLKQRVELRGESRYYVAYTGYYNYYGSIVPDTDSEIIIVCSQTPLNEGVNNLYAVRNGTYDTITDKGFEQTHSLYYIYTYEQWEEYNSAVYYSEIRQSLNKVIDEIEKNAFQAIEDGDAKAADKSVEKAIDMYCSSVLCGQWGDENSQRCYMNISQNQGNFDIEISWSSGASDTTVWKFKGTYDKNTNIINYKNGTRTEIDSSGYSEKKTIVYSDGTGSLYFENNELKWKDNKQTVGDDCRFRKQ